MRVDKYLWSIRIFKSRSKATEHCKSGKVFIGEEIVKSSREVKVGEEITVRKKAVYFCYKVIALPKSRVGARLVPEYMKDITSLEELEKLEIIRMTNKFERDRGMGRPTKRDRRKIDRFKGDD